MIRKLSWLVLLLAFACDGGGGGEGDAGADADTDSDTDSDTGTGEEFEFDLQRVFDDVAWLADDERAGREPGTPGNAAAVEYVRTLFDELGLTPGGDSGTFLQAFGFDLWGIEGQPAVSLDGEPLTAGTGFQVMQYSGGGDVEAEIVFAGHGMTVPAFDAAEYPDCPLPATGYDDFADVDVTGKIALVLRRGPANLEAVHDSCPASAACAASPCLWNFGYKSRNAALHGASGVIVVNNYQQPGEIPAGVTLGEEYYEAGVPVVFAERSAVEAAVPDLQSWSQAIDADLLPHSQATGVTAAIEVDASVAPITVDNVVGVLPGTDPELAEEVIVVGAHVDHLGEDPLTDEIYNGADDNASGTAVVMELARAFVLGGHQTARTIVFAGWNAEELGLIGSCFHVEHPAFPMSQTVAAYSIDMVGAGQGLGLGVYGATLPANAWLAQVMDGYADELGLDFTVAAVAPLDASDHVCFSYAGVPAVMFSTLGNHAYYHTPADTIDTILIEDLEAAVRLSWAGLYPIAMGLEDQYTGGKAGQSPLSRPAAGDLLHLPERKR
jgi:hypothetical protein